MGADAVSVGQHATGWSAGTGEGGDLASSCFLGRNQPALSRPVDRLDPAYHAGWFGLGFGFLWTDLVCYSVGIAAGSLTEWGIERFRGLKLEKVFWPLGFATAVLIKPIFGNGDLESSQ